MVKTIIVYGSTTGNTKQVAEKIAEALKRKRNSQFFYLFTLWCQQF
jgi:flavodoxin